MEIDSCWYQNQVAQWINNLTDHIMVDLSTVIALATMTLMVRHQVLIYEFPMILLSNHKLLLPINIGGLNLASQFTLV
jgi:hypothetical protein